MSATASNSEIFYTSQYRHGLDDKRRLQVPSKWRPNEPGVELTLIVWPPAGGQEVRLRVLPPKIWDALVAKLTPLSHSDAKVDSLRRVIGQRSHRVALDSNGRICIPEWMAEAAGLEKEADFVGLLDRFEIWNPTRYKSMQALDGALAEEALTLI